MEPFQNSWIHCFTFLLFLFRLTVCPSHCCFSFSKTKPSCFRGDLPSGAWCRAEIRSSPAAEDLGSSGPPCAEAAGTDGSRRTGLGLVEHTGERAEAKVGSGATEGGASMSIKDWEEGWGKGGWYSMSLYLYIFDIFCFSSEDWQKKIKKIVYQLKNTTSIGNTHMNEVFTT